MGFAEGLGGSGHSCSCWAQWSASPKGAADDSLQIPEEWKEGEGDI